MCLAVYIPFDPSFSHKNGLVQTVFLIQKVNFIFLNAFGMFEPWSGFERQNFFPFKNIN